MQRGVIVRFNAADGLGDIQLDDGPVVRFGLSAMKDFRSQEPKAGVRVLVGETQPGFLGTLRAKEVRPAEESYDETWHVHGLPAPKIVERKIPAGRIRLVPFDPAAFTAVGETLAADQVALRSFSKASASATREVHPVLAPIATLARTHARPALAMKRVDGEPTVGTSFVGGAFADLGASEWPSLGAKPAHHLLQVGLDDAKAVGISHQINVFLDPAHKAKRGTPVADSLGASKLLGGVPLEHSPFLVVMSRGGARVSAPKTIKTKVAALTRERLLTVHPDISLYRSDDVAVSKQIEEYLHRTYVVDSRGPDVGEGVHVYSIQGYYGEAFPDGNDGDEQLIIGGIAPILPGEKAPRRRVASLQLEAFPEVRPILAKLNEMFGPKASMYWKRLALDWAEDAEPPCWGYGT